MMVALSAPAVAQNPTADAAFKRGRALMKAGKYREACEALEESQRIEPQLSTLFELGGCHEKIGKIASAWKDFREIATRDPDARRRKKAGELAGRLAPRVPKLLVEISHDLPNLAVTLSGRDITEQIGVDIPVDPGTYALTATASGFKDSAREIKIAADGKLTKLALSLEPVGDRTVEPPAGKPPPDRPPERAEPHADKQADPQPPDVPVDQPKPERPASRRKTYAVLSAATGVASIGAMAYFGFTARSQWDNAQTVCGNPCMGGDMMKLDKARAFASDASKNGTLADVFAATGALFLVGSAYLWLTAPDAVTVTPSATATSAGVSLSGRF